MKNLDPSIDSRFWLTITRSVATFEKCASGDFTVLSTFLLKFYRSLYKSEHIFQKHVRRSSWRQSVPFEQNAALLRHFSGQPVRYCDVRGQDAFPLWDEPVRFHRRQRAETFATREGFSPSKLFPSKRVFIVEPNFFQHEFTPWLHGPRSEQLWGELAASTCQNHSTHITCYCGPPQNLIW